MNYYLTGEIRMKTVNMARGHICKLKEKKRH